MTMASREKITKQYQVTEVEIKEFENDPKNPNSWVAKLFADCLLIAEITEVEFVLYLRAILQEEKENALAEANDRKLAEIREEELKELFDANAPHAKSTEQENASKSESIGITIPTIQVILQNQMQSLLKISQAGMNAAELSEHHDKLTANLSNQLSAQLGNTITLDDGQTFQVPQLEATPMASLGQIVEHNPGLADTIFADKSPEKQNEFKSVFTQMELIRLAIKKSQEIYDASLDANPAMIITVKQKVSLHKTVDQGLQTLLSFDASTKEYDHPLANLLGENASLALKREMEKRHFISVQDIIPLANSASTGKPPAMFGLTPFQKMNLPKLTPQGKKLVDELEKKYVTPGRKN